MSSIAKDEAPSIQWRKGDLIGSGAFGRVYMGMNTESGELIAVKEAHPKALQEEAKLLENLSHPKIVRYLGTKREDETFTMLLEYVPGGSIQTLLGKFGSFSIPVIKRFTKQLLLGLEYLHQKGIIHGDIKGANILVDNKGRIKLADFGVSKQAAISGSRPTRGTPYWMAPEVIRGTGHDFSADIWSVGCTVIEMATGNPPWNQQFETHPFLTGKEVESQNLSHSAVMGCDQVISPVMEQGVEMSSSFFQTYSEEIDNTWSDHAANSDFVSDPTCGRPRQLIAEGAIKQVFSNFLKSFKRTKRTTINRSMIVEGAIKQVFSKFSYASIKVATCNFSEENKLGQGGFGTVYKGKLVTGQEIAVKRLSSSSRQGSFEFKNELRLMHGLQHRNILQILGFCSHGDERILIYEYMRNRSLDQLLSGSSNDLLLDWNKRSNIIEGIAQGLVYLHKYSRMRIIHRDVKAGNVLLDEQMNPKIADFGLSRILADNEEEAKTNIITGTYDYMSPEYIMHGIFSMKSDVYSFGVLMLEIISGTRRFGVLEDAWELWKKGAALQLVDPKLDVSCINKDQLLRFIHVGLLCVEHNAADRPTMPDAISMLTNASLPLPKPTLPACCRDRYLNTASTDGEGPEIMSLNLSINSMSISDFSGR